MTKVTAEHIGRAAYIYVRQSTPDQVQFNKESRLRQYGLADRARGLGFSEIVVIDDDLGRSGGGIVRPGFDRMIAAICRGVVGAVFAIEASRLARNGRDWHTLLEFCGLVGCLLIDEDGIYEPRSPNDRLLLGMKGTISEMELSAFRQRSMEALRAKARRGELLTKVAIGYVRSTDDRIEIDPDQRIRAAIGSVFAKFDELGSIRQVLLWFRQERIELPAQMIDENGRTISWRAPVYNTVKHILTNPIYSGAYVYGRTNSRTRIENGRKQVARGMPRPRADWDVLLVDHHEGYISWEGYLQNQTVISGNATMHGQMVRGPARRGRALLAGLIRCGVCGRKLRVGYGGPQGRVARYQCVGASTHGIGAACLAFGSIRVDAAVEQEVLRVLAAVGVTAALEAIEVDRCNNNERCRQRELALEAARYDAERARQQYNAVDPTNRLVAADLERRWNERLACVERLEAELASAKASVPTALGPAERAALQELGADLPRAWRHPAATPDHKKRIVRTVVQEVVVKPNPETLELLVHWQGGDHTAVTVPRNRTGHHRHVTDTETADIITALARHLPDSAIVAMLNRLGRRTGHGLTWTEGRLRVWRSDHHVKVYRDGERAQRGELLVQEVAVRLGVTKTNAIRMIKSGILPASQVCPGAPYVISEAALADPSRIAAIGRGPEPQDPNQLPLQLQ
jgi:DNA invertase Pin-like site-specific DNA recombinase